MELRISVQGVGTIGHVRGERVCGSLLKSGYKLDLIVDKLRHEK